MLVEEMISSGHARALLAVDNAEQQYILAVRIFDEKLSVREVEKIIRSVQKQKEDIQELASMFKDLMSEKEPDGTLFVQDICEHFQPQAGFSAVYRIIFDEVRKPMIIAVNRTEIDCFYGEREEVDVEMRMSTDVMNEIIQGRMTFQRAFMSGDMKMKGDFKVLRSLDLLFVFA